MSYATVMVHVGLEADEDDRVRLAADLAEGFAATLIGAAAAEPRLPFVADGMIVDGEIAVEEAQQITERMAVREAEFRVLAARTGRPVEWRATVDLPAEYLAREARAADLLVVGRDGEPFDPYRRLDLGRLLLRAGRPVLVVPPGRTALRVARALVAWKDGREARRAMRDALPLLRRADEILVATVGEGEEGERAEAAVADVAAYLRRQGLAGVSTKVVTEAGPAGEHLVALAAERAVDLVVAGAYGRTRLGEWIFGGATQSLMTACPTPCLFSH